MASSVSNTILLKGDAMVKEAPANAALTPGHVLYKLSTGKVAKHNVAGGVAPHYFAMETDLLGVGNNPTIDTAYATDDQVAYAVAGTGCEIYGWVAANAAAIVVGDALESDGASGVRKQANLALTTSVGTGDGTIADVGGAFNQATLNNNFKDLADAIAPGGGKNIIGFALEALDNSAVGTPARLRFEVA